MTAPPPQSVEPPVGEHGSACPDRLHLLRWRDGDDSLEGVDVIAVHVRACGRCQDLVAALDRDAATIAAALDDEARAGADEDRVTLAEVRRRLARGLGAPPVAVHPSAPPKRPRWRSVVEGQSWWRVAAAATVLVGLVVAALVVIEQRPVQASADWVLSEWQVRERAWRTQPGKIRQEVYDNYSQDTGKPATHRRQHTLFSTIPGAERTTTRFTDASGNLVEATWRRTDGWGATFDTRDGPHLQLDPATADIEALLATLTGDDAEALRFWIGIRLWQVRPREQAASQAAILGGDAAYFLRSMGTLQGPPQLQSDAAGYRIAFTLQPHRPDRDNALLSIEDTFSSSTLMHERRVIRRVTREGVVLGQSGRQLISRGDADAATLERHMADMVAPPPTWRVTRTSMAEALAEARRIWSRMKPAPGASDQLGPGTR